MTSYALGGYTGSEQQADVMVHVLKVRHDIKNQFKKNPAKFHPNPV